MAKLVVYYVCMLVLFQDVRGDVFIAVITLSQHDTGTEEWEKKKNYKWISHYLRVHVPVCLKILMS